jgi:hypothetical protein
MSIFRWYRQWRERRRLKGRGLFQYWDGSRTRYADPSVVWRNLVNHPKMNFETMVGLAEEGREPEATIVTEALCQIFEVKRWDESALDGLTTWEIMDLIPQFEEYLAALKKNTNPSRMPLPLLAFASSSSLDSPGDPTSSTADSSPTPSESSCAEATAS